MGISATNAARQVQTALASTGFFAVGAALPLIMVLFVPSKFLIVDVFASSLFFSPSSGHSPLEQEVLGLRGGPCGWLFGVPSRLVLRQASERCSARQGELCNRTD